MSLTQGSKLLDVTETHKNFPVSPDHQQFIGKSRKEIETILSGKDQRLIMIVGPCSIGPDIPGDNNPLDANYEYADRLSKLQDKIKDQVLLVMRTYMQKPRTIVGWKGVMHQPNPMGEVDMREGTRTSAKVMHRISKQLPIADEMLYLSNSNVFDPFLSWLAVGARSTEDQPHRELASGKDIPVGMKNPTSGDIAIGVNSVLAAQHSHTFPLEGYQYTSSGNPFAHLVLRGGTDGSNYGPRSIGLATKLMLDKKVQNPSILVDASHANSQGMNGSKDPRLQDVVVRSLMTGMEQQIEEYQLVRGCMMESHLLEGKQSDKGPFRLGYSITDACRGWEGTGHILMDVAEMNAKRRAV